VARFAAAVWSDIAAFLLSRHRPDFKSGGDRIGVYPMRAPEQIANISMCLTIRPEDVVVGTSARTDGAGIRSGGDRS
jgi:hypothetical protein